VPHESDPEDTEPKFSQAVDWLNAKLFPYLGPPELGPYDAESPIPESAHPCPICGHPMMEHPLEVDEETGHRFLHHPDERFPDVMEFG
jgi:hypothetical protein